MAVRPLRFVHTADLHLGKPFGSYASADRLRVARMNVLERLAALARDRSAPHILIAGDLFDTPNPAARTWRQAAAVMAEARDVTWWLLPGNHDNLAEGAATWEGLSALDHGNLRILQTAAPVEMQPGAILLPAPLLSRHPSADPTLWMQGAILPKDDIRIGLAHGPVQGFSEDTLPPDIIAPDRARQAGLDWLALGDWHGALALGPATAYAGAPERTGFGHNGRGTAHVVEIAGPGAPVQTEIVEIGVFDWQALTLDLVPGDRPVEMIEAKLPDGARRDMLVRVTARGRATLKEATQLAALEDRLGPDFCHFELKTDELRVDIATDDLDAIAVSGALRVVADELAKAAHDVSAPERDRQVAEAALRRLHSLAAETAR